MLKFIIPIRYIFIPLIFITSLKATGSDYDSDKFLSRYGGDIETCRYYPFSSTISFKDDKVLSPEYENLNPEIRKHVEFLEGPSRLTNNKTTFMSVILSATGEKNGKTKRVFEKLYVREENDGTPTILITQEENSKILVFSSNDSKYCKLKDLRKSSTAFCSTSVCNLFNLTSFAKNESHNIVSIYNEFYKTKNNSSHAEPLWLATLLTLPPDTFKQLLPAEYNLMYIEIHFLANFDACSSCTKLVCEEATRLKQRFCQNLFIFYHSWYPFIDEYHAPYRVKYKQTDGETNWVNVRGSFNFKDFNIKVFDDDDDKGDESRCKKLLKQKSQILDIREDTNLTKIPSYYFGIIHQYEGKTTNIHQ